MDFGELVSVSLMLDDKDECVYKESEAKSVSTQKEDVGNDDVKESQDNSGGILGTNLTNASHGDDQYLNDAEYPAPDARKAPRRDSTTGNMDRVGVKGKKFDYSVAAHHLIPGNAALEQSALFDFMCEGKKVPTAKGDKEIKANIGYCVNGAHNGVWLPGNYAIRADESPTGETWSALVETDFDWCYRYMVGAVYTAKAQFHDTHTTYNENARDLLDSMAGMLYMHPDYCKICENKRKIAPPYRIKAKLYRISGWFKQQVTAPPEAWKLPWVTSDRFKNTIQQNRKKFLEDYGEYGANKGKK